MSFNFSEIRKKLDKAIDHALHEIGMLRTGRASAQILDPVMVEAYGGRMRIAEVASVQVVDANLITVSPWDKSLLGAIEKGIAAAELNINPVVAGDLIRIMIAPLTEETRREMVKLLHKKIEDNKVMLRVIRADAKKMIETSESEDGVSEDSIKIDLNKLEDILKEYTQKLEDIAAKKEKELMTI